jgi:hypothetical protein
MALTVQCLPYRRSTVRNTSFTSILLAVCLAVPTFTALQAQSLAPPDERFTAATREYALLHRRIEQSLGPIQITTSPSELLADANAMAAAIRAERADARQGDLFTTELSNELRVRIADALAEHGLSPADLVTDEVPEGVSRQALALRVGGPFPWIAGSTMLSCVLEVLPPLPPELQYRFLFRDLALVDVHANFIVDVLPDALAATEF